MTHQDSAVNIKNARTYKRERRGSLYFSLIPLSGSRIALSRISNSRSPRHYILYILFTTYYGNKVRTGYNTP